MYSTSPLPLLPPLLLLPLPSLPPLTSASMTTSTSSTSSIPSALSSTSSLSSILMPVPVQTHTKQKQQDLQEQQHMIATLATIDPHIFSSSISISSSSSSHSYPLLPTLPSLSSIFDHPDDDLALCPPPLLPLESKFDHDQIHEIINNMDMKMNMNSKKNTSTSISISTSTSTRTIVNSIEEFKEEPKTSNKTTIVDVVTGLNISKCQMELSKIENIQDLPKWYLDNVLYKFVVDYKDLSLWITHDHTQNNSSINSNSNNTNSSGLMAVSTSTSISMSMDTAKQTCIDFLVLKTYIIQKVKAIFFGSGSGFGFASIQAPTPFAPPWLSLINKYELDFSHLLLESKLENCGEYGDYVVDSLVKFLVEFRSGAELTYKLLLNLSMINMVKIESIREEEENKDLESKNRKSRKRLRSERSEKDTNKSGHSSLSINKKYKHSNSSRNNRHDNYDSDSNSSRLGSSLSSSSSSNSSSSLSSRSSSNSTFNEVKRRPGRPRKKTTTLISGNNGDVSSSSSLSSYSSISNSSSSLTTTSISRIFSKSTSTRSGSGQAQLDQVETYHLPLIGAVKEQQKKGVYWQRFTYYISFQVKTVITESKKKSHELVRPLLTTYCLFDDKEQYLLPFTTSKNSINRPENAHDRYMLVYVLVHWLGLKKFATAAKSFTHTNKLAKMDIITRGSPSYQQSTRFILGYNPQAQSHVDKRGFLSEYYILQCMKQPKFQIMGVDPKEPDRTDKFYNPFKSHKKKDDVDDNDNVVVEVPKVKKEKKEKKDQEEDDQDTDIDTGTQSKIVEEKQNENNIENDEIDMNYDYVISVARKYKLATMFESIFQEKQKLKQIQNVSRSGSESKSSVIARLMKHYYPFCSKYKIYPTALARERSVNNGPIKIWHVILSPSYEKAKENNNKIKKKRSSSLSSLSSLSSRSNKNNNDRVSREKVYRKTMDTHTLALHIQRFISRMQNYIDESMLNGGPENVNCVCHDYKFSVVVNPSNDSIWNSSNLTFDEFLENERKDPKTPKVQLKKIGSLFIWMIDYLLKDKFRMMIRHFEKSKQRKKINNKNINNGGGRRDIHIDDNDVNNDDDIDEDDVNDIYVPDNFLDIYSQFITLSRPNMKDRLKYLQLLESWKGPFRLLNRFHHHCTNANSFDIKTNINDDAHTHNHADTANKIKISYDDLNKSEKHCLKYIKHYYDY